MCESLTMSDLENVYEFYDAPNDAIGNATGDATGGGEDGDEDGEYEIDPDYPFPGGSAAPLYHAPANTPAPVANMAPAVTDHPGVPDSGATINHPGVPINPPDVPANHPVVSTNSPANTNGDDNSPVPSPSDNSLPLPLVPPAPPCWQEDDRWHCSRCSRKRGRKPDMRRHLRDDHYQKYYPGGFEACGVNHSAAIRRAEIDCP
ncbi:hypothetical protein CSOJ01_12970 [Colletotrichum sojae]|uniref:C2H2-type domain-containing protein n=1 Tax=Colletotrichum sojae TaxID=2175907 RepID=A0A8H6ITY4_9PEZI|nr:hypothetical protein CSOJ01_12970 [Colletotrichum sojae]